MVFEDGPNTCQDFQLNFMAILMAFIVGDLEYRTLMTSGAYSYLLSIISPKEAVTLP